MDSYYEYLVKGSSLLGRPELRRMWEEGRAAVEEYLTKVGPTSCQCYSSCSPPSPPAHPPNATPSAHLLLFLLLLFLLPTRHHLTSTDFT